jgi:hypothetical protein
MVNVEETALCTRKALSAARAIGHKKRKQQLTEKWVRKHFAEYRLFRRLITIENTGQNVKKKEV